MLIDVSVSRSGTEFVFRHEGEQYTARIKAYGKGLAYNALAAIALVDLLSIDVEDSIKALEKYEGFAGRFEIKDIGNGKILVNDAYNANPTSMRMAIETFDEIFGKEKYERIVILGDMKELGEVTAQKHQELGEMVKSKNFDQVYYIGDYYKDFNVGEKLINWQEVEELIQDLEKREKDIAVLLKASHSVGLYNLLI
jgi:UDP-N-acetylmuramoyl-tripeptide--D-alanyl-D-alanine ligase